MTMEIETVHPTSHYRRNLLSTALQHERDGWWVRCYWAPSQYTTFDLFEVLGLAYISSRVLVSLFWYHHNWEVVSTNQSVPMQCSWCGKRAFDAINSKFHGKCYQCGKSGFGFKEWSWTTGPGAGRTGNFCNKCWEKRPKNWEDTLGISTETKPGATFVRYVGVPQITASEHGFNAFGSILAEYSDGSKLGVMCGHGGSAWLCLECANKISRGEKIK